MAVAAHGTRPSTSHELQAGLVAHALMLPLYAAWVMLGAFSQFKWAGALGLGFMWLLLAWFVVRWAHEGRTGIAKRMVVWGLLAWFNLLLVLPLLWRPTRRFLVPTPPERVQE